MKNSNKIAKKSEKNRGKNGGWLVTMLGIVFRVQRIFPNMESVAMLNKKKNGEKIVDGW